MRASQILSEYAAGRRDFKYIRSDGVDLNGASLRGATFFDAARRGANLQGAYLTHVQFKAADLQQATLQGAMLNATDMIDANLSGADLRVRISRVLRSTGPI
jgi:uncharacterized protein YjbI with pentapeptide repeats